MAMLNYAGSMLLYDYQDILRLGFDIVIYKYQTTICTIQCLILLLKQLFDASE